MRKAGAGDDRPAFFYFFFFRITMTAMAAIHLAPPGIARSLPAVLPGIAHSSAFSLIFSRRFSIFLTKNALSVFLCSFMPIFQLGVVMHYVNYVRFSLFKPFFRPRSAFAALLRRFMGTLASHGEISRGSRTLDHASDRPEKAPDKDKN